MCGKIENEVVERPKTQTPGRLLNIAGPWNGRPQAATFIA
jgi:hypothetical protein